MNNLNKEERKIKLAIGVIGNVDSGKSTLTGHLLYLTQQTSVHEQKKLDTIATENKKETFKFAYRLDTLQEERERGVTIKETIIQFKTKNREYILGDLPGHAMFVKNFLSGASSLNVCILLVDVNDGIVDQTKEHLRIILNNGVKRIIVVINKMDEPSVNYSEEKYNVVANAVKTMFAGAKVELDELHILPLSAYAGANLLENKEMPWYTGKTLYQVLDEMSYPEIPFDKPLRFVVSENSRIKGIGLVVQGKIAQGIMEVGKTYIIKPSNKKVEVKTIEAFHKQVNEACPGDSVGVTFKNLDEKDVKKGYIISAVDNAPLNAIEMQVELNVVNPTVKLKEGSDLLISHGTGLTAVKIVKMLSVRDKAGNVTFEEGTSKEQSKSQTVVRGQAATMLLQPARIIAVETAKQNPRLGQCTLSNEKGVVAVAAITHIKVHSTEA